MSEEVDPAEVVKELESFLADFEEYGSELRYTIRTPETHANTARLTDRLQRKTPWVLYYILQTYGNGNHHSGVNYCETKDLLSNAILSNGYPIWRDCVRSVVRHAIGTIEAGMWPPRTPTPVLVIHDSELRDRCSALLGAPGKYDIVLREATTVLENRIKARAPQEAVAKAIRAKSNRGGTKLIEAVFDPTDPILSISSDTKERAAFRTILAGVYSHIRNPSHHRLDDGTEWSWAWSIVGLVDRLLSEVDECEVQPIS